MLTDRGVTILKIFLAATLVGDVLARPLERRDPSDPIDSLIDMGGDSTSELQPVPMTPGPVVVPPRVDLLPPPNQVGTDVRSNQIDSPPSPPPSDNVPRPTVPPGRKSNWLKRSEWQDWLEKNPGWGPQDDGPDPESCLRKWRIWVSDLPLTLAKATQVERC